MKTHAPLGLSRASRPFVASLLAAGILAGAGCSGSGSESPAPNPESKAKSRRTELIEKGKETKPGKPAR